eukprot:TRINITY_DN24471_c0_g1_i1.p1 TRINITY_DN24471_c0_g1~~TRINITY_DN24471_c0_g1_i1.p1  ORF type:complete len:387 (+),score=101.60 TRINITY_DN24471_c0_g1_i1:176-1336(+)
MCIRDRSTGILFRLPMSRDEYNERFAFNVEWYDQSAMLVRKYQLFFHAKEKLIEMFDLKNRRTFLKKTEYPSISLADLYIGATVSIYSRQLKITEFADEYTSNKLGSKRQKTCAIVKPDAYAHLGKIVDAACSIGLVVGEMRMLKLTKEQAEQFYSNERGQAHFGKIVQFLSSDAVTVLELVGENSVHKWQDLMGSGRDQNSIRGQFGVDEVSDAVYGSSTESQAELDLDFFFGPDSSRLAQTAVFDNCTLCIVKPHVVGAGGAGKVIDDILARGFEISAVQMFKEDRSNIEEFFEVYKEVLPDYQDMVTQLLAGPFIAMEVRAEDAVASFREFTGPSDPEIARTLRPHTLRAKYGHDRIRNGLHCTDLPEDGMLEVEYFFKLLQK